MEYKVGWMNIDDDDGEVYREDFTDAKEVLVVITEKEKDLLTLFFYWLNLQDLEFHLEFTEYDRETGNTGSVQITT